MAEFQKIKIKVNKCDTGWNRKSKQFITNKLKWGYSIYENKNQSFIREF